jgi:aminoglycoside/choline kinase family phosphotransferase
LSTARPELLAYVRGVFPGARVEPLVHDASTRRFFRVLPARGPSRVVMDYGRPFEGEPDDVVLARILGGAGLPVAAVLDVCGRVGCLLLEDLGDRLLQSAIVELGGAARPLLERAVRLAADVTRRGTPALERSPRAAGPALDRERFRYEMDFFIEHFARGLKAQQTTPPGLAAGLHALADAAAQAPRRVLCHRDFHSRNLLLRDDGSLAMVDIQDARWGPDSYDVASLLRDAYVEIHESWIEGLLDLYAERAGIDDRDAFRRRFDIVSCQRMIKALGTFGFLRTSPAADRYLSAVPRTVDRLRRVMPLREETSGPFGILASAGLLDPST